MEFNKYINKIIEEYVEIKDMYPYKYVFTYEEEKEILKRYNIETTSLHYFMSNLHLFPNYHIDLGYKIPKNNRTMINHYNRYFLNHQVHTKFIIDYKCGHWRDKIDMNKFKQFVRDTTIDIFTLNFEDYSMYNIGELILKIEDDFLYYVIRTLQDDVEFEFGDKKIHIEDIYTKYIQAFRINSSFICEIKNNIKKLLK